MYVVISMKFDVLIHVVILIYLVIGLLMYAFVLVKVCCYYINISC